MNSSFINRENELDRVNESDNRYPVDVLPVLGTPASMAIGATSSRTPLPAAKRGYSVRASATCLFRTGNVSVVAGGGHYLPAGAVAEFMAFPGVTHIAAIGLDGNTGTLYVTGLE